MEKSTTLQAPTPAHDKLAYSDEEVANLLSVARITVWRLCKKGLLKPVPGLRARYTGTSVRALCAGEVTEEVES
jgi:predicted site-specific integrase-resolvase